ncbi:hypothetical protein EYR36_010709 [Pleurotus pulmonarius]|nr:hypothetical protein EYR36_010709 [Pleurotus pulmonarius]
MQFFDRGKGIGDDCLGFIQHDLRALESKQLVPNQNYNECLIADNVCQTVAPLASHYRQVELDAIRRGISRNDFEDQYIEPETQLMCHHGSTPSDAHSRPCFLTLHLHIAAWGPHDFEPSFIDSVHWSATNNPCALPALPGPFRSLNNIHLNFPSSAPDSHESDGNGPSPRGADTLSFTVSEGGIQGLDGSNSAAAGKFITIASEHRNVRVTFINLQGLSVHVNFISGDAYFGTFNRSNVGGANNVNVGV